MRLRCFRFGDHFSSKVGSRGDEDGERFRIVFGLGHKVGGDVSWVAAFAGNHDLRGAGEHVDRAIEGDETFGSGYVQIAGSDDLVDARKSCGPIGQRSDTVRSADAVELRDAEQMRRGQRLWCRFGRDHHDAFNARNLCRNGRHEQRGWKRMAAAGNVAAN